MKTKILFLRLLLITAILFSGCEKNEPDNDSDGENNPASSALYALDISEKTDWDYMIASEEGSSVFFDIDRQTNIPTNMVVKPLKDDDYAFTVTFKSNGQPDMAIFNDTIVVFENLTDSTVDIAVIYSNVSIKYFYGIDINGANSILLANQSTQLRAVSPETRIAFEHGIKFIGSALAVVGAVGALFNPAGIGVLGAITIANAIITTANNYGPNNFAVGASSTLVGKVVTMIHCADIKKAFDCISGLAEFTMSVASNTLSYANSKAGLTDIARSELQENNDNGGGNGGNEGGGEGEGGGSTENPLIGAWALTATTSERTLNFTLILKEKGIATADNENGSWSMTGDKIHIHFSGPDGISFTLYGTVDFSREYISGNCIDVWAYYDEDDNFDHNETFHGTFTMTKSKGPQNMPTLKKHSSNRKTNYRSIFNNK